MPKAKYTDKQKNHLVTQWRGIIAEQGISEMAGATIVGESVSSLKKWENDLERNPVQTEPQVNDTPNDTSTNTPISITEKLLKRIIDDISKDIQEFATSMILDEAIPIKNIIDMHDDREITTKDYESAYEDYCDTIVNEVVQTFKDRLGVTDTDTDKQELKEDDTLPEEKPEDNDTTETVWQGTSQTETETNDKPETETNDTSETKQPELTLEEIKAERVRLAGDALTVDEIGIIEEGYYDNLTSSQIKASVPNANEEDVDVWLDYLMDSDVLGTDDN